MPEPEPEPERTRQARKLVAQNGFQEVVVVLEGYMEQVELPEKARHAYPPRA